MTVEQSDTVDFIGVERETGDLILTISDHLAWEPDFNEHLDALQAKLNAYLRFIESGEILSAYPDARGRPMVIEVVGQFDLPPDAREVFEKATAVIQGAGFDLRFRLHGSPRPSSRPT